MNTKSAIYKSFMAALLVLFFCGSVFARAPMAVKIGQGEALITLLDGSAQVQSGESDWKPLKTGNLLKGGDEIRIGKRSRLELRLPDQSLLRFSANTHFKIVAINIESNARSARINLVLGKTWANVNKAWGGAKPDYEVASRNAVCGVRGTIYRMNVEQNDSVLVRVYEGEVNVRGGRKAAETTPPLIGQPHKVAGPTPIEGPRPVSMEEWTYIVKSMQQIRVGADGVPQKPEAFTEAQDRDAWVEWNKARDAELEKQSE